MAQGVLPFQYEVDRNSSGMTAMAGMLPYLDLATATKLAESVDRHVKVRQGDQGWSDARIVLALVLLNVAGGSCVDDLQVLEADEGFARVLRHVEARMLALPRRQRRELVRRWRKQRRRAVPSPSAVRRYLAQFNDEEHEQQRRHGQAVVPEAKAPLRGLLRVNADLVEFAHQHTDEQVATLDQDATLVRSYSDSALYCYKGYPAYQPLTTYWAELRMVLHSELRDGNVPAGYQQLRVLKEALDCLPASVRTVRLRSDTAGYQWALLKYCAEGRNERFGVIEFAVGADVTSELKKAAAQVPESQWKPLYRDVDGDRIDTGQQWAELCYVPNEAARTKDGPQYRFLAIREPLPQQALPGVEPPTLPFPTMTFGARRYKLTAIVTNRTIPGDELIWWYRQRCGHSEQVHAVMKNDLAGGHMPSARFGANAAWWLIVMIAFNLVAIMKALVLGDRWAHSRLKALRYALIRVAGRVVDHARGLVVRLAGNQAAAQVLVQARQRIAQLAHGPPR